MVNIPRAKDVQIWIHELPLGNVVGCSVVFADDVMAHKFNRDLVRLIRRTIMAARKSAAGQP